MTFEKSCIATLLLASALDDGKHRLRVSAAVRLALHDFSSVKNIKIFKDF